MKKFVLIFYGKVRPDDISKEQMKATMDRWMAWFGTFQEKIVNGGNPFANGAKAVTAKGVETITANAWPAQGYTIINAKDMEEATIIAKTCPALINDSEGAVRVYEALPM